MNPDQHILALLSEGSKNWKELDAKLSTYTNPKGVCARQTLVTSLKRLVEDGKIKKELLENRTTRYSLLPGSLNHAKQMMDKIALDSLVNELEIEVGKELKEVSEVKGMAYDVPGMARLFVFKNLPRMNFKLKLNEDAARIINRVMPTSDLASQLHTFISRKFYEMRQSIPAPSEIMEELEVTHGRNWSETQETVEKIAMKYGMGFLLLAWYDGREYKQRLMSALKDMRKLEGNHAEDIYFLDEINKRCCYLYHEYGKVGDGVLEQLNDILKISDTYQLLHSAFFFHFGNERELICLEMGLISDCAGKFSDASLFIDLGDRLFSRSVPRFGAYADMKLPFLSENEQRSLLKEFLDAARKECAGVGYSEEHRLAIDVLIGKLGSVATVDVKSPIMNFQFVRNNEKTDFSDEPFVKDFLSYKNVPEKRKWLQKCLLQGLPIFTYIPFEKLGFEVRNIL